MSTSTHVSEIVEMSYVTGQCGEATAMYLQVLRILWLKWGGAELL